MTSTRPSPSGHRSSLAPGSLPPPSLSNVTVVAHPLVQHKLTLLRRKQTSTSSFRTLVAERTRRILPWVGAGLSMPAGLPTWNDLRRLLCDELVERARQQNEVDAKKCLSEANLAQKHQDAWVAFEILKHGLGETTYRDTIRTALGKADGLEPPPAYASLWKLRPAGILSMNLDLFVDRAVRDRNAVEVPRRREQTGRFAHDQSRRSGAHSHRRDCPAWTHRHRRRRAYCAAGRGDRSAAHRHAAERGEHRAGQKRDCHHCRRAVRPQHWGIQNESCRVAHAGHQNDGLLSEQGDR